jgi:hypothetical protein
MIALIEKKLNLLHNINRDNNDIIISKISNNNNENIINYNSHNILFKRNDKRKETFNISSTIYKLNSQSQTSLSLYKENINLNDLKNINANNKRNCFKKIMGEMNQFQNYQRYTAKNRNKNELTPYPFKRLQNKMRKYFSLSKNIRLYEEQIPLVLLSNQFLYKNDQLKELCKLININKICKYNKYKHRTKKNEKIKKEDKSVNTEKTIFGQNLENIKNSRKKNKIAKKNTPQFNNELIASMTNTKDIKLFITTSIKKNKKGIIDKSNNDNRTILVYHKNY